VPASLAARDLRLDAKVLASILSRLAREGAVARVSRGVYRASGPPPPLPELGDLVAEIRRTLDRTFGEAVVSRLRLALPEAATVEDLRTFQGRLRGCLGPASADDLLRKIAASTLGDVESLQLLRRLSEAPGTASPQP